MNRFAAARTEIVQALTAAGITTADHGARFTPPGVVIRAADPWATPGDTLGTHTIRLELDIISGTALTRTGLIHLEALADQVIEAIPYPLTISAPTAAVLGDSVYLAASTTVHLDYD